MPNIRIFTESKADVKFVSDYVAEHFSGKLTTDMFHELLSWSGYKRNGHELTAIRENFDAGNETILMLDADNDFAKRFSEVTKDFQKFNIPVHLFLFPGNNAPGNLEDLLTQIATVRKLIDCFLGYEECVKDYNLPLKKSRIYAYLDAILPKDCKTKPNDLRKDTNRDYRNQAHWDLHHECLQPLHNFLSPFFIQ